MIFGILPSKVLSKLHQRDVVVCSLDKWERQLRLWKMQDRIIFSVGLPLIAFCFFYDLVFIANVTPEDAMAWYVSCMTSLAQTLLLVPLVMTIVILTVVRLSRLSGQVCHEVQQLCCHDNFQLKESTFHRPPQSRWTPASRRRDVRRGRERLERNIDGNAHTFDSDVYEMDPLDSDVHEMDPQAELPVDQHDMNIDCDNPDRLPPWRLRREAASKRPPLVLSCWHNCQDSTTGTATI